MLQAITSITSIASIILNIQYMLPVLLAQTSEVWAVRYRVSANTTTCQQYPTRTEAYNRATVLAEKYGILATVDNRPCSRQ